MGNEYKPAEPNMLEAVQSILKPIREAQARESERRARLTPAERLREDQAMAARAAQAKKIELLDKMRRAAKGIGSYASFTLLDFACLLCARSPSDYSDWFIDSDSERIQRAVKELNSYVRFTPAADSRRWLVPVNPQSPASELRFAVGELMEVATANRIEQFEALASVLPKPELSDAPPRVDTRSPQVAVSRATSSVAMEAENWRKEADKVLARVQACLRARSARTGIPLPSVEEEFREKCSMRALYEEFCLNRDPEKNPNAPVELKTFRGHVGEGYPSFKFSGGRPPAGKPDCAFLTDLLQESDADEGSG